MTLNPVWFGGVNWENKLCFRDGRADRLSAHCISWHRDGEGSNLWSSLRYQKKALLSLCKAVYER